MRFEFVLLADAAQVVDRKLYVHGGGLTRLTVPSLPWMQPLAICMRLEPDDYDDLSHEWQFQLAVVGPDENPIIEHRIPLALHRPNTEPAEGEHRGVLVALTISGLVVHAYGPHRVRLAIEGAVTEETFAVLAAEQALRSAAC